MNTDTGEIYRTLEEIEAALSRGVPVVPVSEKVATAVQIGLEELNRELRRAQQFPKNARR